MAEPDDIDDILAQYKKKPDNIDDILAQYAGDSAKKTEAGWMPTWLKHGLVGGVSDLLSQASMSDPATMGNAITSEQAQHEIESQFTGAAPQPEGFLGRGASDVVRMATNPASWIGPGGPAAKAAFLTASGYGGEAGGTLAEKAGLGPAGQTVARVVGSLTPAAGLGLVGAARAPRVRAAQAAAEREAAATQAAAANQAAAREFDIQMSRGKASGDLEAIRYEDLAARGAHGTPAQDIAAPFFDKEFQDVQAANRRIGEGFGRGYGTAENPSEAAARINAELGAQGEQARTAVQAAEDAARREAAAARSMVDDQGRILSDVIAEGRPAIESPREAGEVVGQAVRSAAARDRANYQGLYDEALTLPGQFHPNTFEGIGTRIQGRLSWGSNNPVIIDDVTTPIASRAIRDLENVSGLRFQNRADPLSVPPHGAPPENYLPVDLRGVDQARKRLVAYYRSARASPNAADARATSRLIDEFDNEIEQAISNGLFSGDSRALGAIQQARAAYSRYARQFRPQQSGDDVGTAMRRIIDRNATPEEIANMIVGSGRIGNSGLPVRMADRLEEVLGRDSEAWSTIRQAIWQRASQVRSEAGGVNTQGINDLVNSSLGRRVFSDAERNAMRTHSVAVRTLDDVIENLGATQAARRAQDEYQRIFGGQDIGGQQARVFRRIIDGTAAPEETTQAIFSTISGNPGNARRVIGAIEGIVGRDSETMALVRDEVWRRLTQNAATKDQPGYQKVSQAIGEFLEGRGRSVATMLYTPEEIALMQRYQAVLKRLVIPKNARTNSDTAPALLQALRNYGSAITATLGHSVDKVIGKVAGSAVKTLIRESANVIGNARAAHKVARSLSPIDLPPPTSTPGLKPATEASPLIKALSRGLATQGARNFITDSQGNRYNYAEGGEVTDADEADDKLLPPPVDPRGTRGTRAGEALARGLKGAAYGLQFPGEYMRGAPTETPNVLTEEDVFRADDRERAARNWGTKTAYGLTFDPLPAGVTALRGAPLRTATTFGAGAGARPPRDTRTGAEIIADNERKYFAEQQAKAQAKAAASQSQLAPTYEPPVGRPEDIRRALVEAIQQGGYRGLRVTPTPLKVGERAPPSKQWFEDFISEDHPVFGREQFPEHGMPLKGPSVIGVRGQDDVEHALRAAGVLPMSWTTRSPYSGYYDGPYVSLIRSNRKIGGHDPGEWILPNGEVVASWAKATEPSPKMGTLAEQSTVIPERVPGAGIESASRANPSRAPTYEDNVRAITTSRQALVDHANKYGLSDSQVEKLLHDLMDYRPLSTKMFKEFVALRSPRAHGGRAEAVKPSKAQTHYRLGNKSKRCELCTMFRAPHTCTAIAGKISKIGLCDLFERKRAYAEGGEVIDDTMTDADAAQAAREAAALRVARAARPAGGRQEGPPVALRDAEGRTQAAYVVDQMARGIADQLTTPGIIAKGVTPETPGQWSEEDQFRADKAAEKAYEWAPGMALQEVLGGVPGAKPGALGMAGGKMPIPPGQMPAAAPILPGDLRVSTRFPTAKAATQDPLKEHLSIGLPEMRASPGYVKNVGVLDSYPGFAHLQAMSTDEAARAYIRQAAGNLDYLYRKAPEVMRQRSPLWYEGAHTIADAFANRWGVPRQSASAALAALSPQMNWLKNASLGERVGDIVTGAAAGRPMTSEMAAMARSPKMADLFSGERTGALNRRMLESIRRKKLDQITDPFEQALWVRLYDEAHNPRRYRDITPEGNFGDFVTKGGGGLANVGWGGLDAVEKAIRALRSGGDINVISPLLGREHKVRSFYNNIENPNYPRYGDITADTHQVAAAQLRPLAGSSVAVKHNLSGGGGSSSSDVTGVSGTYGLTADATRAMAANHGLLPRAAQSATWEPLRELFRPAWKSPANLIKVDNIWRAYDRGEITIDQARDAVVSAAGGIGLPSWGRLGPGVLAPSRGSTYR
jgi:hypothetical protein